MEYYEPGFLRRAGGRCSTVRWYVLLNSIYDPQFLTLVLGTDGAIHVGLSLKPFSSNLTDQTHQ
jgi:hypothetical protein